MAQSSVFIQREVRKKKILEVGCFFALCLIYRYFLNRLVKLSEKKAGETDGPEKRCSVVAKLQNRGLPRYSHRPRSFSKTSSGTDPGKTSAYLIVFFFIYCYGRPCRKIREFPLCYLHLWFLP